LSKIQILKTGDVSTQPESLAPGLPTHSFLQTLSRRSGLRLKQHWYSGILLSFNAQICSSYCWNIHLKWQRHSFDEACIYIYTFFFSYKYLPMSIHMYFTTTDQSQHILTLFLLRRGLSFGAGNSVLLVIRTPYSPVQNLVTPCQTICSFLAELVSNFHGL